MTDKEREAIQEMMRLRDRCFSENVVVKPSFELPKVETFRDANGNLCKRFVPELPDYPIKVTAPNIFNPFRSYFLGLDTAAPDNTEIRIIVKKRNIKFNFKN